MKRFATAVVAAATALSLSTGTAGAQEVDLDTLESVANFLTAAQNGVSHLHDGSSAGSSDNADAAEAFFNFHGSSYKNDVNAGYEAGTTADILWGVGIAAAVVGALVAAAKAAGIPLPF